MNDSTEPEAVDAAVPPWQVYDDQVMATGFFAMARRLPVLGSRVLREAWSVSRRDTLAMVVLTLVAEVFTAVGLLATTGVLEELLTSGPTPDRVRAAAPALIVVVGSIVLRAVLREGAAWARARLDPQLNRVARTRLLELTTQVELVAFDDGSFHDQLHRVRDRAVYAVSWLLGDILAVMAGVIGLVAVASVLTVLHPSLLPLLLLAVIPTWWAAVRAARMRYKVYAGMSGATRRMETLADLMAERASAAEVRAYTMRSFLLEEFIKLARYEQVIDLRLERKLMISRVVGDGLGGLGTGVVFLALGLLLFAGSMPLAVAGTAVVAIRTATGTLAGLAGTVNRAYENGLFYQDYLDFCAEADRRLERQGGAPPPAQLDRISVQEVTFTYPSAEEPALRGINIDIQPGEIIALVGENGSGKTTLAKVISGLYAPETGTVSYGGIPVDKLDLAALREQIAVIAQDFTHWPFSARQNITIGRHDHPDSAAQLAQAAEASGADAVFERLPKGYDTLLDPSYSGGTELSGGQWQRIAVARGLYRDAPLLICDEPTAALDARTEHAIFETIRRHAAQRTVVLITHRLASVRYADRIFVLDKGLVAEHGTHKELMAADGIYAEFYSLQAQAYA